MLGAVKLDDQAERVRDKVAEIGANTDLAAEMLALTGDCSERGPQGFFQSGRGAPHGAAITLCFKLHAVQGHAVGPHWHGKGVRPISPANALLIL